MPRSTIVYHDPPAAVIRRAVDAVRAGVEAAVEEWHEQMMPDHFTPAGGKKYAYQPRKGDDEPARLPNPKYRINRQQGFAASKPTLVNPHYSWRKRREKRHNKPLVWSGESERAAKSTVRVSSRKKAKADGIVEAAAAMDLPKYFYQVRKPGYHASRAGDGKGLSRVTDLPPDKPAELTRALPDEERRLGETVERVAATLLNRPPAGGPDRGLGRL